MDDNKKYWCAFSRLTKSGASFVNKLYEHFGSIDLAWKSTTYDLWHIEGLQKRSIEGFLEERVKIDPDESIEYLQKKGIDFISYEDNNYPYLLKQIDTPPVGLYVLGDISCCNLERTIGVVGSRKASENSKTNLRNILSGLYDTDICIVSGMAEGIDTVAHRSAIDNNIKTIAVLGGGFDKIYPKSNLTLFNEIINGNGAVITEYWPDTDAISWHFPARNRIVSGLSKGVLVGEAALKSGAMITANLALEQGRELMCMPGLISNPNTEGIYKLIKTGAHIITKTDDILEAMSWTINSNKKQNFSTNNDLSQFNETEKAIIECIQKDTLSLDEIMLKISLNINDLMVILTKLEIDGIVEKNSVGKYISLL